MKRYIITLDYGILEVRYKNEYCKSDIVDLIQDCEGNYYEVKENDKGKLVALLV